MDAGAPPPLPGVREASGVNAPAFGGRRGLTRLLLKNAALTVVTLTFYRFWARTALRRWFWGNVRIAGEPLEYTGAGGELFIGFLIALAVLTPIAMAFSLLQELALADRTATIAVNIGYGVILTLLTHVAIFRARRYRLSRTRWRGIRCAQAGHTGRYVALAALWNVIAIATAGIAYPRLRVALQRYKMRCTRFGNQAFSFAGSGARLILPWLLVYALVVGPIAAWISVNWEALQELIMLADGDANERSAAMDAAIRRLHSYAVLPFAATGGVLAWINYRVAELRHFTAATRFGAATFSSAAKTSVVVLIVLGFIFVFAAWLALISLGVTLSLPMIRAMFPAGVSAPGPTLYLLIVIGGMAVLTLAYLGWYLLSYRWFRVQIMRHVCETLVIGNLASVDAVLQSQALHQKFGEGLADGFDAGGA
jgi:uncharacterized membrane protein YjgN (DUF898 family)